MKKVAGLGEEGADVRANCGPDEDPTAIAGDLPGRPRSVGMERRRQKRLRSLLAIAIALLPGCESVWRPYLEPCDFNRMQCRFDVLPSNGIDPAWFAEAQAKLSPTEDLVVDTDQGTVTTVTSKQQLADVSYHRVADVDCGGGWKVGIGVFGWKQISIPDGVRVRFTGSRAAALIALGPIEIEGLLDLRGGQAECSDPSCPGPGGFAGGSQHRKLQQGSGPGGGAQGFGGGAGAGEEAGGGGGGACGVGGKGGDSDTTISFGGSGGPAYLKPTLVPLCGGSGGGAGGIGKFTSVDPGQRGGGGGGAIQIVSQTSVSVRSTADTPSGIQAGGGGGQPDVDTNYNDGGGGGGSGGAILIEAPIITIGAGAVLAANGGGGAGGFNEKLKTTDGQSGLLSATPAAGGSGTCSGGAGGAGSTPNGSAAQGLIVDGGAGGGGAVGRIRLNSLDGSVVNEGVISPSMGECQSTGRLSLR